MTRKGSSYLARRGILPERDISRQARHLDIFRVISPRRDISLEQDISRRARRLDGVELSRFRRDISKWGRVISPSEITRFRPEVSRAFRVNSSSPETSRLVQAPDGETAPTTIVHCAAGCYRPTGGCRHHSPKGAKRNFTATPILR